MLDQPRTRYCAEAVLVDPPVIESDIGKDHEVGSDSRVFWILKLDLDAGYVVADPRLFRLGFRLPHHSGKTRLDGLPSSSRIVLPQIEHAIPVKQAASSATRPRSPEWLY